MNKTKIIATLGPKSDKPKEIGQLISNGVNVFRINMSHINDYSELKRLVGIIRKTSAELEKHIGILMDIAGPKIRVKSDFKHLKVKKGDLLTIGSGNSDLKITLNLSFKNVKLDSRIKIDDGKISFSVNRVITSKKLEIKALNDGIIYQGKGVNFPNIKLDVPALTKKDIKDIKAGARLDVDWFALSFVRSKNDIKPFKKILRENKCTTPIIAKIEKPEAVKKLDSIIEVFDGVLVARGDLAVEMGYGNVPIIQKRITRLSHKHGKPVILATQMLESMIYNDTPTRAEVNDIAVAVEQSCDAVMLSAETSVGKFPIESVKIMSRVISNMENEISSFSNFKGTNPITYKIDTQVSICHSASNITSELNAKLIVAMTESGSSAMSMSLFRPSSRIIALSPDESVSKKLSLIWGLETVQIEDFESTDDMIKAVNKFIKQNKILRKNDQFVMIAGVPTGISGTTNMIRIETIK